MKNPLLTIEDLPAFSAIEPQHVEPAIDALLTTNREQIHTLLAQSAPFTWENLLQPLEALDDKLSRAWSAVSHMNAVVNTPELRQAHNACLAKISAYATELGQNTQLYQAVKAIQQSPSFHSLSAAQQKVVENELRDFRLAGVELPAEKKARFKQIQQRLSELTNQFEQNVLDATDAWHLHITDETVLQGIPPHAKQAAREAAEAKQQTGWRLTLDFPCYFAVITYADDPSLREKMHEAYATRASDQGPNAGQWDNSQVMLEILQLRQEKANLLGFENYAELSLATKMAETSAQVLAFLQQLAQHSREKAQAELTELRDFAKEHYALAELQPWDIAYYSEKLRQAKYAISQETLRPYFPEDTVLQGMFSVIEKLYAMQVKERHDQQTWHADVRFFEIYDDKQQLRGQFYMDLYARPHKRSGAWMDECRVRRRVDSTQLQTPVAFLTCNFSKPSGDAPALFTHEEVITLFHEFGHTLHHLLTQVEVSGVSGINGVPWDAVEFPSQFMEEFCWQKSALDLISGHYQTGEKIPDELFTKMLAAKHFQAAMQMVRQLEFSLFDFHLHQKFSSHQGYTQIQQILDEIRSQVAVITPPAYNRFQHSFGHIFAGGYAAGYYSYKWAEVLSCDAFSLFLEHGIFDRTTGQAFLHEVLEQGGVRDPQAMFIAFRGREPRIDALLQAHGILS
jgi:oligopeptidase A